MDSNDIRNLQEAYLEVYQVDEAEKWIQKAIKKPGALSKQLGVPEDENIPAGKLAAAAKKGGKLGKRARLAMTLKGLRREEIDLYDAVFTHLLDEGYANTEEAAHKIVMNMSEEWVETILEADVLAKKGGVEGVGTGANWRAKAWSKAEKSRFTSYKKPTTPAAKSSEDAPKASAPAAASRPQTTPSDVALQRLKDTKDRRDFEMQAMAARKSPVAYARKLNQMDADSKSASADEKQRMYWDAKDRADNIQSVHKFKDQGYAKKWADTNYRQNLAMRNNDPNYDPTKTQYPDLPKGALLKYDKSGKEIRK